LLRSPLLPGDDVTGIAAGVCHTRLRMRAITRDGWWGAYGAAI